MIIKKEFYFIRHGQTDFNISPIKVDHGDIPLNATGRKQAKSMEPLIATLPIKSVCCSPLRRAKETKETITKRLQANYYEIQELGECTLGVWKDMTAGLLAHTHVKDFIQRVLSGVNQALTVEGPSLIVAHGGVHFALCSLMNIKDHDWVIDNCLPVHFFVEEEWKAKKLA